MDASSKNSPAKNLAGGGTSKRIGYIDALKGFAIVCVVFGHVANGYLEADIYPESEGFLNGIYNFIYTFHMPLFMMISGFVYCAAYFRDRNPNSKRIYKQVLNLVAIYFIFSISFGLFKVFVGKFTNNPVTIVDIFLIMIKPIYPYWYLYILIFLYLIFANNFLHEVNTLCLLLVFAVLAALSQMFSFPYFEINKLLYYSFFFYVGIILKNTDVMIFKMKILIIFLFCISVILCIVLWNSEKYICNYLGVSIVIALGISLMLWLLFKTTELLGGNRFLQTVGKYSLEIYVIHCVFTAGFRTLFPKIGIDNIYLSFVLNGVISTSIPIVFSVLCKKLNIHGLLFKPVTYISDVISKSR